MNLKLKGGNLVLGLASGYQYKDLAPFIESLSGTNFKGDIVWFVSNIDKQTLQKLRNRGVLCIEYNEEYPYFKDIELINILPTNSNQPFRPNSLRFIFYKVFLDQYGHLYQKVLHADTRDVFFQKNIFLKDWDNGVYCFLEDDTKTITSEKYNAYWIKVGFGDDVLDLIGHNPVSCCGVVYGTSKYFKSYIDVMVKWIIKIPPQTGVLEQGIHNYLIYTAQIDNLYLIKDDEGEVSTLTYFKSFDKIKFDSQKNILNKRGERIAIIHQYDRHLSLLWRYNKSAFFEKVKNLTKRKILNALGKQ